MQAIHTRYLPATDRKGARIKAYTRSGMAAIIPFPYEAGDGAAGHFLAVLALVDKYRLDQWDTTAMRWGYSSDNRGYSFCFANSIAGE